MSDPGVVDPIRIPPWLRERVEASWRDLPRVARVFLVLALVDVVARAVGVVEPRIQFGDTSPFWIVAAIVPHDLWILLPALIVARRPDAQTATRSVFLGAVVLALVELLASPLFHLIGGSSSEAIAVTSVVSIIRSSLLILGWVVLARGLAALNPRPPAQAVAGLSNLVALSVAGELITGLVGIALESTFDLGDAGLTTIVALSSLVGVFQLIGWGYLLWIVVRGLGDSRRPPEATVTATVGACIAGFIGVTLGIAGNIAMATQTPFDVLFGAGGQDLINGLYWVVLVLGPTLLLVAFALGLAEPPIPLAGRSSEASPPAAPEGADAAEAGAGAAAPGAAASGAAPVPDAAEAPSTT